MVVSFVIVILLIFGFLLGFKRGFTYQLIKMLGVFIVLFLSITLKDELGLFLLNNFDVFISNTIHDFIFVFIYGIGSYLVIRDKLSLSNLLVYQTLIGFYQSISFIILFFIFNLIFRIILKISASFEKLLKATIILGIPSKILGGILGFIEYYIYVFLVLIIVSLPIFNLDIKSGVANFMLNKTPIISKSGIDILDDVKDEYKKDEEINEQEIIDILIKNEIISKKDVYKLIKDGKIKNVEVR